MEYEPHDENNKKSSSRALAYLYEACRMQGITFEPTCNASPPSHLNHTRLQEHLYKFYRKADHIYEELGPWATDYFILQSIETLENIDGLDINIFAGSRNAEKRSLLRILNQGPMISLRQNKSLDGPYQISSKVECLISFLEEQDPQQCSGLLFVKQRVTVSVLKVLLSKHPGIKGRFRCATFVGTSNSASKRYGLAELLDLKAQQETLTEFRAGYKNLIIATDALEEGIDVTACNLVICFDRPPNLKSFIQRRGRARQEKSKFALMYSNTEGTSQVKKLLGLEESLIQEYKKELRQIQDLGQTEDEIEVVPGELKIQSTG
jgi:ERCC4-related helicase